MLMNIHEGYTHTPQTDVKMWRTEYKSGKLENEKN